MYVNADTTPDAHRYNVYFNGKLVQGCVEADDRAGYIVVLTPKPHFPGSKSGDLVRTRVAGTVYIKKAMRTDLQQRLLRVAAAIQKLAADEGLKQVLNEMQEILESHQYTMDHRGMKMLQKMKQFPDAKTANHLRAELMRDGYSQTDHVVKLLDSVIKTVSAKGFKGGPQVGEFSVKKLAKDTTEMLHRMEPILRKLFESLNQLRLYDEAEKVHSFIVGTKELAHITGRI